MPTKEEIEDTFDTFHSFNLLSLLNEVKDETCNKGINILNNTCKTLEKDFIELIKYNIDYKDYYQKYLRNNTK